MVSKNQNRPTGGPFKIETKGGGLTPTEKIKPRKTLPGREWLLHWTREPQFGGLASTIVKGKKKQLNLRKAGLPKRRDRRPG